MMAKNKKTKASLVARGFQETMKPQSDSPTMSKESFKMLMAFSGNEDFMLALVDIRAAFLQSRRLDRDVFMLPPSDIRKPEVIWKLKTHSMAWIMPRRSFGFEQKR